MAHKLDLSRAREELIQAVKQGDEARARSLVLQLGAGPRQARTILEAMLEEPNPLARQAAAFGLGELGGATSVRRLEQQLALEEARGDYDGAAVAEDITRALGRIEDASARASLLRRLERLANGKPEVSDVNELARALWRRRHPDLLPGVHRGLEALSVPQFHGLHGLLVLLEKSPEELASWACDPTVSLSHKTRVLTVLEEDVPDTLVSILPAFISTAETLNEQTLSQDHEAEYYCERLIRLMLTDRERLLLALPEDARSSLRTVALRLIRVTFPNPSTAAAVLLEIIGRPEDASFLEAHSPEYPTLAKVFRDAAQTLRNRH